MIIMDKTKNIQGVNDGSQLKKNDATPFVFWPLRQLSVALCNSLNIFLI